MIANPEIAPTTLPAMVAADALPESEPESAPEVEAGPEPLAVSAGEPIPSPPLAVVVSGLTVPVR